MKSIPYPGFSRQFIGCAAMLLAVGSSMVVHAQTVYRIVGPDGKVSFSDQPPASAKGATAPAPSSNAAGNDAASGRLPFELAKVARQFPVVLYTGKDCAPCNSGRNLLVNRGIPFAEKTVENNESVEALRQLSGQSSLPLLSIGSQQLKGFSDTSWSQYLNAAGYPDKSALPSNYKRPSASPLAEAKVVSNSAAKPDETPKAPGSAAREVPVAPPTAGIRF